MEVVSQTDPRRWRGLAVTVLAALMVVLDVSIINLALPQAQRELCISDASRHWAVTAYVVAFGGFLLLGGKIVDDAGRKRTFIVGMLGFAGASLLGGLAPTATLLFITCAGQGMCAAALAPAALALVNVAFTEPHERARAFGIYGAVQGADRAIGLLLGA